MKRVILLSLIISVSATVYAQNDSIAIADSVIWSKMLDEVAVKGHRHIVRVKGNTLVAHVANTELAQLGTANDVLSRLPFINMDDEGLTVVGKGEPTIFINNRPVRSNEELQLLKSESIKDIQIITSPGAEYSSDAKAIIKIQTKQSFAEGLSGKITSQTTRKRVWEETAMADLSYNREHWQVFGQLIYNNGGARNKVENTTNFLYNEEQCQLLNTATQRNKLSATTAKGGFNWNKQRVSLGAYYQYTNTPTHVINHGTEKDRVTGNETEPINKFINTDSKSERHLISVYYDKSFKNKSTLHFDGNYVRTWYNDENLTRTLHVNGIGDENVPSKTKMTSNLWAAKLYYEIPLLKGKLNIGTEDSYTSNEQGYTMLNEIISSYIPSSKDESRQQNYAAYATYAKSWNAFSVQVGLRWEFVKFEYKHNRIQDDEISRTDNNLSPNISLSYNFDDKTFVALDYAHTIPRPPYKQLRSSLLYVGPYEVEGGNPTLGDCNTNTLGGLFGWNDLTIQLTYRQLKDTYVFTKEHYTANSPILIFSPHQADIRYFNAYLSYAPVVKFWKPNLTFGVDKQWLSLYGENYGRPIFRYMLKNMFTPSKNWLMTLDFIGNTRGHVLANETHSLWYIDLSVRRFFLQKRLQIALSAYDIFHTRNQSWLMNIQDVNLYKDTNADTQKLTVTVTYQFNPKKSRYKGKVADEKEVKRL